MTGDSRARDAAARKAARSVFDRPLVLEAGAGSGKTATLVARVVAWCLGPGWDRAAARLREEAGSRREPADEEIAAGCLARVTAITFTEKAAAEMADRCGAAFERLARGEGVIGLPPGELALPAADVARRATALATRIDRLEVTTIHGFCSRLLGAWPLEAGLRPGFEIDADGRGALALAETVVAARQAARAGDRDAEDLVTLAAAGIGPRQLAEALAALLAAGARPGELERDPFPAPRQEELAREVALRARKFAGRLHATGWSGRVADRVRGGLEELATAGAGGDLAAVREVLAGEAGDRLLDDLGRARNRREKPVTLLPPEEVGTFRAECAALRELCREAREIDPPVLGALHRVLAALLPEADREARARGIVGFDALLAGARRLLGEHRGVLRAVRASLDQLLVDEVQDTDPLQYEIVGLLALEEEPGPRPGLFVVGDPKQSIYGFRSADLGAYENFLDRVRQAGGEVHSLVVNYRSVPAILDEVARSAGPLLGYERGVQAAWKDLVPAEDGAGEPLPGDRSPVEFWASWKLPPAGGGEDGGPWGARTRAEEARELEAAAIARDLRDRIDHDPAFRPGRVAILLRATTGQQPYLEALRGAGIPCVVERERDWARRRDVVELAALVRAVVDPADRLALVTFLRAPFAGVPDAALPRLWRAGFPALAAALGEDPAAAERATRLLREVAAALREREGDVPGLARVAGWEESAVHAVELLAELRESFRRDRVDAFVRRLGDRLLPFAEAAARWQGETRVLRQRTFLRRLFDRLRGLPGSPRQVLRALREAAAGLVEEDPAAPADEAEDAVRVLTIHKAKGLTFDEVYLVDLHHGTGGGSGTARARIVREGDRVIVSAGGMRLPGDAERGRRQGRREAAEACRMFYVAITRPRRRLVVCGCWPEEDRAGGESLLERLAAARPGPFGRMVAEGKTAWTDEHGVRYRVLGGESGETRVPGRGNAAKPPDPGPPLAAAEARRVEAAARSAWTLLLSPSGAAEEPSPDEEEEPLFPADPRERDVLLAAGTVVHRLLERFDPGDGPEAAWNSFLAEELPRVVAEAAPGALREAVAAEVEEILAGFAGSGPFRRFVEVFPHLLGREVPVALAADPGAEGGFAWSGTIDLLYRDPATGEIVVADHKTDRAATPAARERLVRHYAPQLAVYARAVARALGLSRLPRRELWFLREGRIEPVPGE